ncbi:MAG: hypothetical protein ACKPCM_06510, partial [Pseudanabaena sp.]
MKTKPSIVFKVKKWRSHFFTWYKTSLGLAYSYFRSKEPQDILKGLLHKPFKKYLGLVLNAKRCKSQINFQKVCEVISW